MIYKFNDWSKRCVIQKVFPYGEIIQDMKLTKGKLMETIRRKKIKTMLHCLFLIFMNEVIDLWHGLGHAYRLLMNLGESQIGLWPGSKYKERDTFDQMLTLYTSGAQSSQIPPTITRFTIGDLATISTDGSFDSPIFDSTPFFDDPEILRMCDYRHLRKKST